MNLKRIIMHHTGGSYSPSAEDRRSYHFIVDGEGKVVEGDHKVSDNGPSAPMGPGQYAAHCLNLNRGSIGISICAMGTNKQTWAAPYDGPYPVKPVQVDAMVAKVAELCRQYGINPQRDLVLSHAEVEPTLGVKQRNKWDFDYNPRTRSSVRDPIAIGDELRQEVAHALTGVVLAPPSAEAITARPLLKQGDQGQDVIDLQKLLGFPPKCQDGIFGPKTRAAVIRFQAKEQLKPDGYVGNLTWAALTRQKGK